MRKRTNSPKNKSSIDKQLLAITLTLVGLGVILVADASAPQALAVFGDKLYFFKQQIMWAVLGLIVMIIASYIPPSFWEKMATPFFLSTLILLIVVLIPGIGSKLLGARRWISLGSFSLQPSELVKLSLAIYLAKVSVKKKAILAYLVPLSAVAFLIMLEPDLGTTLIVTSIGMSQIFASGVSLLYFFASTVMASLAALTVILLSDYRRDRLMTFIEQSSDPLGKSYHIRQVLLSLGLGGLFGVGLGQSRQKYLFLPESATDSIFAIVAEEIGFVGACVLIGMFMFFIFRGLRIAASTEDKFASNLAIGLTVWIAAQVILNIGSMVALVPLTGVPLPFISYGGSSLVMVMLATGVLLGISRRRI